MVKAKKAPAKVKKDTWYDVSSTNVRRFRYNPDLERLTVQFLDQSMYSYYSVTQEVADDFLEAGSPGHFVWAELRHGYAYRLLSTATPGVKRRVGVAGPGSRLKRPIRKKRGRKKRPGRRR